MRELTLGDVCEKTSSNISQKSLEGNTGMYPIYGASGLIKYVDFYHREKEYIAIVKDGAGIGRTMLLPAKSSVIGTMQYIIPDDTVDVRYLYYAIVHMNLAKYFSGATIPHIYFKDYRKESIKVPDIEQQREVVAKLDRVDDLIEKRKAQIESLDNLTKSRFIEMFGDQKTNPFGWMQSTIGECCTLKSGTSLPSDKENEGGTIPYVKVGDMNYPGNEQYITTSSRFVTKQTAGMGIFPVGTVIFPKRGGAIGTNKKRLTIVPICADLNVMGVTAGNKLRSQYLMSYFNMIDLGALDNGSSVPQINNKDIAPLAICIPPIELQNQFADFVAQVDKSKLVNRQFVEDCQCVTKIYKQEWMKCQILDF